MKLPYERELEHLYKTQPKHHDWIFRGCRRGADPMVLILEVEKRFLPKEMWQQLVDIYNNEKRKDIEIMQHKQSATMMIDELEGKR